MADANPSLEKAIKSQFAPALRRDGFAGSGRRYWRVIGGQCQLVAMQGSQFGGKFAVNLAIQPLSVPLRSGEVLESKRLTEERCAFRRRLTVQQSDQWWEYEADQHSMDEAARQACEVYEQVGRNLLQAMADAGSPLNTVTAEAFAAKSFDFRGFGNTGVLTALTLAQMRRATGDVEQARAFAQIGLDQLGDNTTARVLQADLRELLMLDSTSSLASSPLTPSA